MTAATHEFSKSSASLGRCERRICDYWRMLGDLAWKRPYQAGFGSLFLGHQRNCKRIAKALGPYHPRLRDLPKELPFIRDEKSLRNGSTFTLSTDLGAIDLLAEVSGLGTFYEVMKNSFRIKAFDREVWTLNLNGLIKAKRAAGREKDLRILPELESLLEAAPGEEDDSEM